VDFHGAAEEGGSARGAGGVWVPGAEEATARPGDALRGGRDERAWEESFAPAGCVFRVPMEYMNLGFITRSKYKKTT
jgi:hypothetical protein